MSSLREVIPSLLNTLRRCHSTVRTLRNNSLPISALLRPFRASRAMCSSCGVSSFCVSICRFRTFSAPPHELPAGRLRRTPRHPSHQRGRTRARSSVRASTLLFLTTKPLTIQEVGTREFRLQSCATEPSERLPVPVLGVATGAN